MAELSKRSQQRTGWLIALALVFVAIAQAEGWLDDIAASFLNR